MLHLLVSATTVGHRVLAVYISPLIVRLGYAHIMATPQYPNFPRANVLVLGSNAVQALLPSTLISQADALLLAHRLEDAADLADQQRKKLQSMLNVDRHEVSGLLQSVSLCHLRRFLARRVALREPTLGLPMLYGDSV